MGGLLMFTGACSINFRNQVEFFDAIAKMGKITSHDGNEVLICETPFAAVRQERHIISNSVDLNIFKISPKADIYIPFEFDSDYLEIKYTLEGICYLMRKNGHEDILSFSSKHFGISPPSSFRGCLVYRKDQPCESISFHTTRKTVNELLGETVSDLWAEAFMSDDHERNFLSVAAAPPDIVNSFLQIVDCDYPSLIKRLFIESKFREILTRIIAQEVRVAELSGNDFETEQIKKIPGILMERIYTLPSTKELAGELSINTTAMKRGFKHVFGLPIYAYHRNVCLELAAAMLLNTKKTVSEIAIDIGYSCSVNFCYAFKRRYGVSPGRYRKNGKYPYEASNLQG
jgi:AraC-like DNA-binding protein